VPLVCLTAQEDADRLASHHSASTSSSSKKDGDFVSPQQRVLFSLFDSYADVFYAAKPYSGGPGWLGPGQPDEAMDAVLLHVLNHCAKTADVIKKNNDKIKGLDPGACGVPVGSHFLCSVTLYLVQVTLVWSHCGKECLLLPTTHMTHVEHLTAP